MWLIYTDKERNIPGLYKIKLFLDLENFDKGFLFAWNISRRKGTKFNTKLEAETAAIHFTTKHPEWIGKIKTTWMRVRV